jgi:hypothetical protein
MFEKFAVVGFKASIRRRKEKGERGTGKGDELVLLGSS